MQVNVSHYPFLTLSILIEVGKVEGPSSPVVVYLESHALIVPILSYTSLPHRAGPQLSTPGAQACWLLPCWVVRAVSKLSLGGGEAECLAAAGELLLPPSRRHGF